MMESFRGLMTPEVYAVISLVVGIGNAFLRTITTQPLSEK
jgi:hypothetical protein